MEGMVMGIKKKLVEKRKKNRNGRGREDGREDQERKTKLEGSGDICE